MLPLPPFLDKLLISRKYRCPGCDKLVTIEQERCDHCDMAFSEPRREEMRKAYQANASRNGPQLILVLAIVIGFVYWLMASAGQ